MSEVTRDEWNSLEKRVTDGELCMAATKPKVDRNELDIQNLWKAVNGMLTKVGAVVVVCTSLIQLAFKFMDK